MDKLWLKEKMRHPSETCICIVLYAFNILGLMGSLMGLYFIGRIIFTEKKQQIIALFSKYNIYAGDQFDMMLKLLLVIMIIIAMGLFAVNIKLQSSDTVERKYQISLMKALGYRRSDMIMYEVGYKITDLLGGIVAGSIGCKTVYSFISNIKEVSELERVSGMCIFSADTMIVIILVLLVVSLTGIIINVILI